MLIVRGVNVFPRELEAMILADPDLGGQYAIIVDRRGTLTELRISAEVVSPQAMSRAPEITGRLQRRLTENTRLRVAVELQPPGSMPRPEVGKAKRVFEQTSDRDPLQG